MLQVITGMYFRDAENVNIHPTEHRRTLYTNADFCLVDPVIDLGIASLTPATDGGPVNTVLAMVTERLETTLPDGSDDLILSTGGDTIISDLAIVLSFALNATVTPVRAKADRVIKSPTNDSRDLVPADILPRTFTPHLMVSRADIDDLRTFFQQLLPLNRETYERAMRAMRRIVTASERVAEDPTLAYTDYVAALESLSAGTLVPGEAWTRYPSQKRKLLDPELDLLPPEQAESLRSAILKADKFGASAQYREFVIGHVRPSFFRDEVAGVDRPLSEPGLRRAVMAAYEVRSHNIHSLEELPRESWLRVDGAHTINPFGNELLLTHEGLNRLARHVVRTYVQRGSTTKDDYQWRDHLPNVLRVQMGPGFHPGDPAALTLQTAPARAGEFVTQLIELEAGRVRQFPGDMRPVLQRIESLLGGNRPRPGWEPLLTIYLLWHRRMAPEWHRPNPDRLIEMALTELQRPGIYAFSAHVLLGDLPDWSLDDLCDLAEERYKELQKRRPDTLPPRLDSALWALVAGRLLREGFFVLSRAAISRAVGCSPGAEDFLALERQVVAGTFNNPDLRTLVLAGHQ